MELCNFNKIWQGSRKRGGFGRIEKKKDQAFSFGLLYVIRMTVLILQRHVLWLFKQNWT